VSASEDDDFSAGWDAALHHVMSADLADGIESDAVAFYQASDDGYSVALDVVDSHDTVFRLSPREARCLAASLLRAAHEAEQKDSK
jgi:hypothetical protein